LEDTDMVTHNPVAAYALIDLIRSHRITDAIFVAAELGIADLLAQGPRSAEELARLTETHPRSLLRLVRALAALGICKEAGGGKFELTEMGTHLTADSEYSVKAVALLQGGMLRDLWGTLIESVRTGKTGAEQAGRSAERFEDLAKTGQADLFNRAMISQTRLAAPAILEVYDFAGIPTLMDVGGGLGALISSILRKYPSMRGIVFDLPHCAAGARSMFVDSGVADRAHFIAGSFFDAVPPGADAIVLKNIIIDWNDERCLRILANCYHALKPGARLMVIERIMPATLASTADHVDVTLVDLNMLRGPGGGARTEREHRELLAKGGFRVTRIVSAGRHNLIEATRA
jgi:hypothetical protein